MAFYNLRSFIQELKRRDDLLVIDAPVSPILEIAEIHRRVIAAGGPALLFTNVEGKKFPVVTNLFGTKNRVDLAFGSRPCEFVKAVASLPETMLPPTPKKVWGMRHLARQALKIGFKRRRNAPVLEHRLPNADLTQLPALTSWKKDGGPFLTLPLVHTQSPAGGPENLGMYRIQIHDAKETGMHFQIGKGGGFHLHEAEQLNQDLPTNIYLGGPPSLILSAIAPLPEKVPELMLCSMVLGEKLKRASAPNHPIDVVSEAEFCLSGYVPNGVRRPEGPFGDHYGYYSLTHDYPVFRPHTIWHREKPIFPATVVGKPRQEDFYIGDYLQELLLPMIPLVMPAVHDLWSYGETGYHALSAAVLKERYHRESMASVFRILGEGQVSLTKFLIALDRPMDLRDFRSVLTYVLERVDWQRDLYVFSNLSMDTLDYAGPEVNKGSKGVILGMGQPKRALPKLQGIGQPESLGLRGLAKRVAMFCPGCLVVEAPGYAESTEAPAKIAAAAAQNADLSQWQLIVVVDDVEKATKTTAAFLWTTFTRFEPAADIYASSSQLKRNHVAYQGPIVIDARMKTWYPEELFCDDETAGKVDRRWMEYFPQKTPAMGSSNDADLYR